MYVKAPKEIVDYLAAVHGYDHHYDTSNDRQVFADGSYLLWERDFLPLCASEDLSANLASYGCVALTAMQVRAEQDGEAVNELPPITDETLLAFLGREAPEIDVVDEPTDERTEEPIEEVEPTDNPAEEPATEVEDEAGPTEPVAEEGGDA